MSTIQPLNSNLEPLTEEESSNQPDESAERHRTSSLSDLEYFQEHERRQNAMASAKERRRASTVYTPDRIAAAASISAGGERSTHARRKTLAHVAHETKGVTHRRPRLKSLVSLLPELPEAFHENTQRVRAVRRSSVLVQSTAFHAPAGRKFSILGLTESLEEPVENHSASGC